MSFGAGSPPAGFMAVFFLIAAVVIGFFVCVIVSGIRTWVNNNNSPVETVDARIVAKRQNVSGSGTASSSSTSTWYYVTFEISGGDRMELGVSGKEYGMLAEGDRGQLTHQGTRYKGFERVL